MLKRNAALVAFVAISSVQFPLRAQGLLGTILGSVSDSSGGGLPDADVAVTSTSTHLLVKGKSRGNGLFQIPNLPIGNYSVTFSKTGFQSERHPQILVEAGRSATVNATLQVGSVSSQIEVTGTPLLNEVDTTNGYVLGEGTIRNTPLGTGSFTQLAILSPGVNADFLAGSGSNAGLGNQAIWANGQRDSSNSFVVNGVSADNLFSGKSGSQVDSSRFTLNTGQANSVAGEVRTNTSVYDAIGQSLPSPPIETLQEVRVNTAMYDATQGARSGAHVALITKSGTNQYHGEAYEYFQNSIMNAAPFFRNANTSIPDSQKVPPLHYNRFGATFGGPVIKDKLFFFGSYQGNRIHDNLGGTSTASVPLDLTDDRSASALATVAQKDLGITISPSQIDPAALKLMSLKYNGQYFIPSPSITNLATARFLGYNVTLTGQASTSQADLGTGSLDYNWSSKDRMSAKYIYQQAPNYNPYAGNSLNGFGKSLEAGAQLASIDNTTVLRPNLTWENKIGFIRQRAFATTQQPFAPSDAGINLFGLTTLPTISLGIIDNNLNKSLSFGPSGNFANTGTFQNRWDLSSQANWVLGRHTLSFGANWTHTQLNIINENTQAAAIAFTNFSQFLIGAVNPSSSTFYNGSANRYYRADQVGAYIQDNYKLKSNLTLNLGVRYDLEGPFTEKHGTLVNFDSDLYQYNAATDTIANSGLVFAGNSPFATKGVSDTTLKGRQWGFGPRIGVVWSPKIIQHLTIRSGFGIYYDRGEYFTYFSPGAGRGFSGPFGVTMQLPFVVPFASPAGATLTNPFGATAPSTPGDPSILSRQLPNLGQLTSGSAPYIFGGYDAHNSLPYTENWSFDVQYQPFNSWVFSLGYVGNHGENQVLPIPFNQPGIATAQNPINGQTSSYGFNIVPAESVSTSEGGNSDLRVPYPGYSSNSVLYRTVGVSNYHSLQSSVRKRFSNSFQMVASYTYSHALDEQSNLGVFFNGNNPLEPKQSYGSSTFDRTHVFTTSYYYELPKTAQKSGVLAALVNNWALSGVVTLQSGQPYNLYDFSGAVAGLYNSTTINVADPILGFQPGVSISQIKLQSTTGINPLKPTIDTSKIYLPTVTPGTFGVPACASVNGNQVCDTYESLFSNTGRNTFRGSFQSRWDTAISKRTRLNERLSLDIRMDVFNVFNHPDFDVPSVSSGLYSVTRSGLSITGISRRDPATTTLGLVQQTLGSPRILQLSAHLVF